MGRLGRKIFGMSKEDYVQKYGVRIPVASGDYYNLNVEVRDKRKELTKIADDKNNFENKLQQLFEKQRSTGQHASMMNNTANKFNKTTTAQSSSFERYRELLEMMEHNHQNNVVILRNRIEKLKAEKIIAQEQPASQKLTTTTHASHNGFNARQDSNRINKEFRPPVVYQNGHHFACKEEMWV